MPQRTEEAAIAEDWVRACGGTEQPFETRSARALLYMWNRTSGEHAYYDVERDVFLTRKRPATRWPCTDSEPGTSPGFFNQFGKPIMEYIDIGSVPADEPCAQVGCNDYWRRSGRECTVFKRMLYRLFPIPDDLAVAYVVRANSHEFGRYREVAVRCGEIRHPPMPVAEVRAAVRFGHYVEAHLPDIWDTLARYELDWYERSDAYLKAVRERTMKPEDVPAHYAGLCPPEPQPAAWFGSLATQT
ncbi:MAG: hypothetical protein ABI580_14160 [Burkholderiaceae bacterium]